jgi:signal transduction histidine kinase
MTLNVQDLLDYAQINASKFRKHISRFNIINFIKNVIEMQQDKADDQGIELKYEF